MLQQQHQQRIQLSSSSHQQFRNIQQNNNDNSRERFLRNANSQEFPQYMINNPNFYVRTQDNKFKQINDKSLSKKSQGESSYNQEPQGIVRFAESQKRSKEDKKKQFVVEKHIMSQDNPMKTATQGRKEFVEYLYAKQMMTPKNLQMPSTTNNSNQNDISLRKSLIFLSPQQQTSNLKQTQNFVTSQSTKNLLATWNKSNQNGELTKFLNASRDVEDQKRISMLFLPKDRPINIVKKDLQMKKLKGVNFNIAGSENNSQSNLENQNENNQTQDLKSTFYRTSKSKQGFNLQSRSQNGGLLLTTALRESSKSQVGMQLKRNQIKENKQFGAAYVDIGTYDFYANVNSRRQSKAHILQQKIDHMRIALSRHKNQGKSNSSLSRIDTNQMLAQQSVQTSDKIYEINNNFTQQQHQLTVQSFHENEDKYQALITPTPTTTVTNYPKNSFTTPANKFIDDVLNGQPIYVNPAIRDKFYQKQLNTFTHSKLERAIKRYVD
eukprot:403332746